MCVCHMICVYLDWLSSPGTWWSSCIVVAARLQRPLGLRKGWTPQQFVYCFISCLTLSFSQPPLTTIWRSPWKGSCTQICSVATQGHILRSSIKLYFLIPCFEISKWDKRQSTIAQIEEESVPVWYNALSAPDAKPAPKRTRGEHKLFHLL